MKELIGDCIYILDNEDSPFSDATEMAQCIENSNKISLKDFLSKTFVCDINMTFDESFWEFGENEQLGIVFAYDSKNDIHYFYN